MKKKICMILMAAFVLLFGTSAYFIYNHYRQDKQQAELYDSLADLVDSAAETEEEPAEPILYTEEKAVLPELAELYQQNSDLAGWIHIEDTDINYPVMHTPDNPDFYLKHGFDKEYSDYGCPYVQENCDVQLPSDNVIIYGHHMKNGSMFCDLEKFKSKDFWQEQKDSLTELLKDENNSMWSAVLYGISYSSDQIVTVALSQVGNVGGEPYWSWYGFGSRVEWCACFVSWCANECGYIDADVIPKFAGCINGVQWFKDRGQWLDGSAEPVPGMIIFFDWDDENGQDGESDHVGIVEKVENGIVYTVEGNSGDSCRINQYSVGYYEILGYGVSQY